MASSLGPLTAAAAWVASVAMHSTAAATPYGADASAVRDQLRAVQVELYCDREQSTLQALRHARSMASTTVGGGADTRRALEEAAWHIRRHDSGRAHLALVQARDNLA